MQSIGSGAVEKTYEEPHARAQACRAESVEGRHMWPEGRGEALERLRRHFAELMWRTSEVEPTSKEALIVHDGEE